MQWLRDSAEHCNSLNGIIMEQHALLQTTVRWLLVKIKLRLYILFSIGGTPPWAVQGSWLAAGGSTLLRLRELKGIS